MHEKMVETSGLAGAKERLSWVWKGRKESFGRWLLGRGGFVDYLMSGHL